eukprot:CAMPEP_0194317780 /NCGR_PEP_ID=MMETSP0171-20130528/14510_1 /TAXON_ID=218684 /ORGANISM="Corethron pennatum, Strain L29A3" /LENGTH=72 /DNA_ID=CAMNT_0039074493 /DNA_START=37 /DNA_END=255 /DNA_ORIENTATION=+
MCRKDSGGRHVERRRTADVREAAGGYRGESNAGQGAASSRSADAGAAAAVVENFIFSDLCWYPGARDVVGQI